MKKIRCPFCYEHGETRILGEFVGGTVVEIARARKRDSHEESTFVFGDDFYLCCGACRQIIHVVGKEDDDIPDYRFKGILRQTFINGTIKTESYLYSTGTALQAR